jgi:hypothetical protein
MTANLSNTRHALTSWRLWSCWHPEAADLHPSPAIPAIRGRNSSGYPAAATVYRGETVRFAAQVSHQSNQAVTWNVDPLSSIDSTGLYTAPSDFDGVSVVVIATSKAALALQVLVR